MFKLYMVLIIKNCMKHSFCYFVIILGIEFNLKKSFNLTI